MPLWRIFSRRLTGLPLTRSFRVTSRMFWSARLFLPRRSLRLPPQVPVVLVFPPGLLRFLNKLLFPSAHCFFFLATLAILKEKGVRHYPAWNYEFPYGNILFLRDNDLPLFTFPPSIPHIFLFWLWEETKWRIFIVYVFFWPSLRAQALVIIICGLTWGT